VLPVSGDAFVLDDLAASFTEPWICARAAHLWDAVRTGGCTLEAAEAVCDANLDTLSRPAVSGGRSKANRTPGPSDSGRTTARSSKPSSSAWMDPRSLGRAPRAVCSQSPRRPASTPASGGAPHLHGDHRHHGQLTRRPFQSE
jgi:hypothetical protein